MATVTLVGYGLGNIQAFANIYHRLNIPVVIASNADQLLGAEKLILPGVGAFDWAISRLNESGMRTRLDELVLHQKIPVLGVCVGMQMMANHSEEGKLPGLGWIEAEVVRFQAEQINLAPRPHMGWTEVKFSRDNPLSKGIGTPGFISYTPTISLRTRTLKFWLRLNTEVHSPLLYQRRIFGEFNFIQRRATTGEFNC